MKSFDLNTLRRQLARLKAMGSISDLIRGIPGISQMAIESRDGLNHDKEATRIEAMIDSMTPAERRNPGLIDRSRQRRIAAGSNCDQADVSALIKQFDQMKRAVDEMNRMRKMFYPN